jgi:hypothetical protein
MIAICDGILAVCCVFTAIGILYAMVVCEFDKLERMIKLNSR